MIQQLLSGDQLSLRAMKVELKKLKMKSDKLKNEVDEYLNVGTELYAIHREFAEIVKADDPESKTLKKLNVLTILNSVWKRCGRLRLLTSRLSSLLMIKEMIFSVT